MPGRPHQSALRKGRVFTPRAWYTVTSCVVDREPRLIADPCRPAQDPGPPATIIDALRWLDTHGRCRCHGYVVMPDHLHLMVELGGNGELAEVMRSFSRFTARNLNRLQGRSGAVWQKGFYDHQLRDDEARDRHLRYLAENPVRKGYVARWQEWPWTAIYPDW
jgi:REP element-mobilizing transposase RayT